MSKQRRDGAICGATVHRIEKFVGTHDFHRWDGHPCYLKPRHDGEHRCWTLD